MIIKYKQFLLEVYLLMRRISFPNYFLYLCVNVIYVGSEMESGIYFVSTLFF